MDFEQLFLQRYNPLYDFWLAGMWETVPADLMRQRPHARLNSIGWILWHLTRVEDAGVNSFVAGRAQVFDDGGWMPRLNLPWRHQGTEMTFPEVDDLSQWIDLEALHAYSDAVRDRTRETVTQLNPDVLGTVMEEPRLRTILFDEGLAKPEAAAGLLENYRGWSRGKCLMNFGLTHPYQHIGEIEAIATLLGVEF